MEEPKLRQQLVKLLARTAIFADTTERFRQAIILKFVPAEYEANQQVWDGDAEGSWLGVVVTGRLHLSLQRVVGNILTTSIGPGGTIGDPSLFGLSEKRCIAAIAIVPTMLLTLDAAHFHEILDAVGPPPSLSLILDHVDQLSQLVANAETFVTLDCFRSLEKKCVLQLHANSEPRICYPGQVLMMEGTLGKDMFVFLSGACRVEKDGRLLAELSRGAVLGELAVIGLDRVRSATVVCSSLSVVRVLHTDVFHEILSGFPAAKQTIEHSFIARSARNDVGMFQAEKAALDKLYGCAHPFKSAVVDNILGLERDQATPSPRGLLKKKGIMPLPRLRMENGAIKQHVTAW